MLTLKYVLLGIIQGFTEPLPISSSGHLKIMQALINSNILNDLNFEIIVNFGSLIAVLFLYKKDIINLIADFFNYIKTKDNIYYTHYKYSWCIMIGTIPAGIIGILMKDTLEKFCTTKLIGIMLLITSLFLYIIKDIKGEKEIKDINYMDALKIGLWQVLALMPGISRSGSTIVGAMKSNLKIDTALNFSFMLYIPISFATMILGISDIINSPNINKLIFPYTISMIASLITTYFSLKLFINIMKNGKLIYFSIYCLFAGLITFFLI